MRSGAQADLKPRLGTAVDGRVGELRGRFVRPGRSPAVTHAAGGPRSGPLFRGTRCIHQGGKPLFNVHRTRAIPSENPVAVDQEQPR